MYYSIENVFYEYQQGVELNRNKEYYSAAVHYRRAVAHYDNADDIEKIPSSDCPVTMSDGYSTVVYPSLDETVERCNKRWRAIFYKRLNDQEKEKFMSEWFK